MGAGKITSSVVAPSFVTPSPKRSAQPLIFYLSEAVKDRIVSVGFKLSHCYIGFYSIALVLFIVVFLYYFIYCANDLYCCKPP